MSKAVEEGTAANVLPSSVRMSVVGSEKTLSQEIAPEVRANAVLPSSHDTPRVRNAFATAVKQGDYESEDAALEARTQATPPRRLADPMELGYTVEYLSSSRSGFINGETLPVDGGSAASPL
ncbi:MAG: SDR family oxidoreductase [Haloarculaceae archaeon]